MSNERYPAHMASVLKGKHCGGRSLAAAAEVAIAAGTVRAERGAQNATSAFLAQKKRTSGAPPSDKLTGPKRDFLNQLLACGLPEPELEYRLIPGRQYRGDFCWPEPIKVCCEYQGIFGKQNASHASIAGLMRDYRKTSMARVCARKCR